MFKAIIQSFKIFLFITLLTGIIYPFIVTLIGQTIFPYQSNGSIIFKNGNAIGSELIGQNFQSTLYFSARPSTINYNPFPSGASNFGVTNKFLHQQVNTRKYNFKNDNYLSDSIIIPSEMLFASASGVDPHISVQAAKLQVKRILKSRNINAGYSKLVYHLIDSIKEYPQFGVLGNQVVNVLSLNLKLDELSEQWKTLN